jgi:hypothetical protein
MFRIPPYALKICGAMRLRMVDNFRFLLEGFDVHAIRTPIRAPKANSFCERLIGTIRRECLDFLIPLNEQYLRRMLAEFVRYYNRGRPHSAWGPAFRSHSKQAFQPAAIGINFLQVAGSDQHRFSAGCTMIIAWRRRSHSVRTIFLRSTGDTSEAAARMLV